MLCPIVLGVFGPLVMGTIYRCIKKPPRWNRQSKPWRAHWLRSPRGRWTLGPRTLASTFCH
ncbi:hypothetical protein BJY00DRAFT_288385 [Aspergillus carlsbadensis]|nr:hypothetical protein BJY00DRAFT_288385 [Aspergillus carlsbadensis]